MNVPNSDAIIAWVGAILSTPLAVKFLPRLIRGILDAQRTIYDPLAKRVEELEAKLVAAEADCDRRIAAIEARLEAEERESSRLRMLLFRAQASLVRHGITPPDGSPEIRPPAP